MPDESGTQEREYRDQLLTYYVKSQDDYDKTLIMLAGGALGVSFAFVDRFIDPANLQAPCSLIVAWCLWGLSLLCVLISFFSSNLAARKAMQQYDHNRIWKENVGGVANAITAALNVIGGLSFTVGVFLMIHFVTNNLEVQ